MQDEESTHAKYKDCTGSKHRPSTSIGLVIMQVDKEHARKKTKKNKQTKTTTKNKDNSSVIKPQFHKIFLVFLGQLQLLLHEPHFVVYPCAGSISQ